MPPLASSSDPLTLLTHLPPPDQSLLRSIYASALSRLASDWSAKHQAGEIFWLNLYQRSGGAPPLALDRSAELDAWCHTLVSQHYEPTVELDGYGFVLNPCDSRTQAWHLDYSVDYSNLFVPLTLLTPENAMQCIVPPLTLRAETYARAIADPDIVNLAILAEDGPLSIRQLLAPPFSLLKLDFGAIHRGISNTGKDERVMFWLSVKRPSPLLPVEPLLQHFPRLAER